MVGSFRVYGFVRGSFCSTYDREPQRSDKIIVEENTKKRVRPRLHGENTCIECVEAVERTVTPNEIG